MEHYRGTDDDHATHTQRSVGGHFSVPPFGSALVGLVQRALARRSDRNPEPAITIEAYRLAVVNEYRIQGLTQQIAILASLALLPIDDEFEPALEFEQAVGELALATARQFRQIDQTQIGQMAADAITRYIECARDHGETYYEARYQYALDEVRFTSTDTASLAPSDRFGVNRAGQQLPNETLLLLKQDFGGL